MIVCMDYARFQTLSITRYPSLTLKQKESGSLEQVKSAHTATQQSVNVRPSFKRTGILAICLHVWALSDRNIQETATTHQLDCERQIVIMPNLALALYASA